MASSSCKFAVTKLKSLYNLFSLNLQNSFISIDLGFYVNIKIVLELRLNIRCNDCLLISKQRGKLFY